MLNPSYNLVKPVENPVDKESKEYKERLKKASNNFLASPGVELNKTATPIGFPSGKSSWNLTKTSQSRGDDKSEVQFKVN